MGLLRCRCVWGPLTWGASGAAPMESHEGPPVSSPDPAITTSVEEPASSSTHAVAGIPTGSLTIPTRTQHSASDRESFTEGREIQSWDRNPGFKTSKMEKSFFELGLWVLGGQRAVNLGGLEVK